MLIALLAKHVGPWSTLKNQTPIKGRKKMATILLPGNRINGEIMKKQFNGTIYLWRYIMKTKHTLISFLIFMVFCSSAFAIRDPDPFAPDIRIP
jgi:hypothetical protein